MRLRGMAFTLLDSFGRSALRQPVFTALLILPMMMGLFLRLVVFLLERYLPAFDLQSWIPLFMAVTAGFPPYLYGLLAALMLVDERDRELLPALRVTPLTDRSLVTSRIIPASVLASFGVPVCLYLSGQVGSLFPWAPMIAGLFSVPLTVFYALVTVRLSNTKVQALTVGKVMGTALIVPFGLVLLPTPWSRLFLLFPASWTAAFFIMEYTALWALGAILFSTGLAAVTWRSTLRSYFS